jgi:hypothetical protein
MRKALLPIIFALLTFVAAAQQPTVTGKLTDTAAGKNLARGTVSLLRAGDSTLVGFSRSDSSGAFRLHTPDSGHFLILVTYPTYTDYFDTVRIAGSEIPLGTINLTPRSKLMEEILVKKRVAAIQYRGDTTIYTADSFKVKEGATVEDLLRVMPGFTIDKSGKITAQGERVQKVLVDGEEFFSDDPTIATRNLNANMIQDVEVFNKKSDQAEFTGIDDGSKTKTINLKMKEDKKNGYFGKVEAGSDLKKYYNNNAMANYFKGKKKFSAYGILSNTGKTGLNWSESTNYGGGNSNMEMGMGDDGGVYMMYNNGDEFTNENFEGEGIPRAISLGAHYSDKWSADKQHANGNYRYNQIDNDARIETRTQSILPDTVFYNNETNHTYNYRNRHLLEGIYDLNLDSSSSIKMTINGSMGENRKENEYQGESLNGGGDTVNSTHRFQNATGDNKALNSTFTFRKKFKEQGHTFSVNIRETYTESGSMGFLLADNRFFDSKGFVVRHDTVDQKKTNDNRALGVTTSLAYTRPISKRSYLAWDYALGVDNRQSARFTYQHSVPGKPEYDQQVSTLSNSFSYHVLENNFGMTYRYNKPKKLNFSIGAHAANTLMDQTDLVRDSSRRYSYWNFFPRANLSLQMKKNRNLYLTYYGNTQQPSIQQLQPIADNSDPLNLYVGNPNLRPSLSHNLYLNLGSYNVLEERGLWVGGSAGFTENAFSSRDQVDSIGRRIYQTINVQGNYNYDANVNYSYKFKKTNWNASMSLNLSGNQFVNYVNGQRNETRTHAVGIRPDVTYNKEKVLTFSYNVSINYNRSASSIRPDINTNYWTQEHHIDVSVTLPWKLYLNTDMNLFLRQKTEVFPTNNNVAYWNMAFGRKFMKDDAFRVEIYANDLLNQNRGFRRDISSNYITEKTYNTYGRFIGLVLKWNFAKNGKPSDF